MESQNSEQHSIEDISDVSGSISSAMVGIIEEAEKLQRIIYSLDKANSISYDKRRFDFECFFEI